MRDYNNAVNTETGSPEKNLLLQWAPAQHIAGLGVSGDGPREEPVVAQSEGLRAGEGGHDPSSLTLTNYK